MDTEQAYVWRLQNFVLGEHILKPCPENPAPVKVGIMIYFTILLVIYVILMVYIYFQQIKGIYIYTIRKPISFEV